MRPRARSSISLTILERYNSLVRNPEFVLPFFIHFIFIFIKKTFNDKITYKKDFSGWKNDVK